MAQDRPLNPSRGLNHHRRGDHGLIRSRRMVDVTSDEPTDFYDAFLEFLRSAWEVYQTVRDEDVRIVLDVHVTDHPDPLDPDNDSYEIRGHS